MRKSIEQTNSYTYDKIADRIPVSPDFYQNIASVIGQLKPKAKLLDIGCGNGDLLRLIARTNPHASLTGLDFSRRMLESAANRLPRKVKLVKGTALSLPFEDNTFDFVVLSEVLEHLENPIKGLVEAKRVLKNNGNLIITFPNTSSYRPFYPWCKNLSPGKIRYILTPSEDPEKTFQPIDRCLDYDEVIKWINRIGFKIQNISGTIFFHYLGEVPIVSSLMIFLWRRTSFDKILNQILGPSWAYRVLIKASKPYLK